LKRTEVNVSTNLQTVYNERRQKQTVLFQQRDEGSKRRIRRSARKSRRTLTRVAQETKWKLVAGDVFIPLGQKEPIVYVDAAQAAAAAGQGAPPANADGGAVTTAAPVSPRSVEAAAIPTPAAAPVTVEANNDAMMHGATPDAVSSGSGFGGADYQANGFGVGGGGGGGGGGGDPAEHEHNDAMANGTSTAADHGDGDATFGQQQQASFQLPMAAPAAPMTPPPSAPALRPVGVPRHDGTRAGRIADLEGRMHALVAREAQMTLMYKHALERLRK
jgi:hypothetical protein